MSNSIFARKGDARPAVTEDQAKRAMDFANRRVISLNAFARPRYQDLEDWNPAPPAGERAPVQSAAAADVHPDKLPPRKFSLRLDRDLHFRFHRALAAKHISGQKLLIRLLCEYLEEFEEQTGEVGHVQS